MFYLSVVGVQCEAVFDGFSEDFIEQWLSELSFILSQMRFKFKFVFEANGFGKTLSKNMYLGGLGGVHNYLKEKGPVFIGYPLVVPIVQLLIKLVKFYEI